MPYPVNLDWNEATLLQLASRENAALVDTLFPNLFVSEEKASAQPIVFSLTPIVGSASLYEAQWLCFKAIIADTLTQESYAALKQYLKKQIRVSAVACRVLIQPTATMAELTEATEILRQEQAEWDTFLILCQYQPNWVQNVQTAKALTPVTRLDFLNENDRAYYETQLRYQHQSRCAILQSMASAETGLHLKNGQFYNGTRHLTLPPSAENALRLLWPNKTLSRDKLIPKVLGKKAITPEARTALSKVIYELNAQFKRQVGAPPAPFKNWITSQKSALDVIYTFRENA